MEATPDEHGFLWSFLVFYAPIQTPRASVQHHFSHLNQRYMNCFFTFLQYLNLRWLDLQSRLCTTFDDLKIESKALQCAEMITSCVQWLSGSDENCKTVPVVIKVLLEYIYRQIIQTWNFSDPDSFPICSCTYALITLPLNLVLWFLNTFFYSNKLCPSDFHKNRRIIFIVILMYLRFGLYQFIPYFSYFFNLQCLYHDSRFYQEFSHQGNIREQN